MENLDSNLQQENQQAKPPAVVEKQDEGDAQK
jgi:hypothetical protein